jgi:hypothetical protein
MGCFTGKSQLNARKLMPDVASTPADSSHPPHIAMTIGEEGKHHRDPR